MVGIIQEKQTPKIAKKLLKIKISCNSSHCKANCSNILAVCVCVYVKILTLSCKIKVGRVKEADARN